MPQVTLQLPPAITREQFKTLPRQRTGHWWLARIHNGDILGFLKIASTPQFGFMPLTISRKLQVGTYLIGCGSSGNSMMGLRKKFKVNSSGEVVFL